jgi:hypothetical protein
MYTAIKRLGMIAGTGFVVLLAGCITPSVQPIAIPKLSLQLAPADLGATIALQQHLKVERNGKIDELDAALEVDSEQLQLVGLAFGQRVLSLDYDGVKLTSWRHFMLPEQVRAEDVLQDIQLTLWPLESIRHALPVNWRIEDNGLKRDVYFGDELVCEITYSSLPRWSGTVHLVNLHYHYALTINSLMNNP